MAIPKGLAVRFRANLPASLYDMTTHAYLRKPDRTSTIGG